ncbi:hypothetical protein GCM10025868_03390 [Angustibacter aerolatus]|uniref:Nicotinamide mononucleotide transporter n=1 Tax=Angustibacter aerolatus TaxID=1162965 RepID=A0ABQ6JCC0_9ACTN|nr:hypothetical protein GCM10025868_03390 [Angustibacter aerolatus]
MRRRVWAWPVGIVGNVLLFTVFVGTALGSEQGGTPLYGQAGRQVFFIITSVYGWVVWRRSRRAAADAPAVRPRWANGRERLAYLVTAGLLVVFCYWLFQQIGAGFPAPWWYYVADSWIFVGSMLATFAMARGWVDFWLCWIAVDLVGVPEPDPLPVLPVGGAVRRVRRVRDLGLRGVAQGRPRRRAGARPRRPGGAGHLVAPR